MSEIDEAAVIAPMLIARRIVEDHIRIYGMVPHPDMMKDAIAAALASLRSPPAPTSETAWLIEMQASQNREPPRWWHPQRGWVWDANEAIRFAREIDAEEFSRSTIFGAGGKVTEHVFAALKTEGR